MNQKRQPTYDRLLHRQMSASNCARSGVMALDGAGAGPGPGTLGALGRLPCWRRRGYRRPLRTGRTARSRRSATQATSSSRSGSVPPRSAVATRTAYWSFLFCRPRNVHSARNRSRIPSRARGSARLAPHQSSASAARRRRTSPGKVLSRGCSGASSPSSSKTFAPRASVEQELAGGGRVLRGGLSPGSHTPRVGPDHRPAGQKLARESTGGVPGATAGAEHGPAVVIAGAAGLLDFPAEVSGEERGGAGDAGQLVVVEEHDPPARSSRPR